MRQVALIFLFFFILLNCSSKIQVIRQDENQAIIEAKYLTREIAKEKAHDKAKSIFSHYTLIRRTECFQDYREHDETNNDTLDWHCILQIKRI